MTKSQSGMVTKGITQLATNTLSVLVIQSGIFITPTGWVSTVDHHFEQIPA